MKHISRRILPLGLLAALAGCSHSPEAKLVGTWKIKPSSLIAGSLKNSGGGANAAGAAIGAAAMSMLSLDIRADKTFSLTYGAPMEGTWTLDETSGVATLSITRVGNQTAPATPAGAPNPALQLTAQIDDSDSTLSLHSATPGDTAGNALSSLRFEKS